jgi:hypothetical protein
VPHHHLQTGQMHEAEEVLDVVFPSGDEAAEVVHPGEQPLHFPAPAVAAQFASMLALAPSSPVRGNQLDVVFRR